ncbi:MAG TPA: diguanylate cyclase [Thermoanaerobaculia bacterium]
MSLQSELDELREYFRASTAARLEEMARCIATLQADPRDTACFKTLSRHFHALAGLGTTYGFPRISEIADIAEGEILALLRHQAAPDPVRVQHWGTLVAQLREALRAGPETPAPPPEPSVAEGGETPAAARVLIVEDDPLQSQFIGRILGDAGYDVHVCAEPALVDEAVARVAPELVLMDVNFPGPVNGYDLVRALRQRSATLPVIFVTTEGEVAKTHRAGGDDHLRKPVDPAALLTSVSARIERARVVQALIDQDGLTGALTHSAFHARLEHAVARAAEPVLALLDLDHFKQVNDTHGHRAGDRVLSAFGRFLRQNVRYTDAVGRVGGEEFGVLLEGTNAADAARLMERLLAEFSAIQHLDRFAVTFSAGIAALPESREVEAWIEAADRRLYQAKREGRARVVGEER